MKTKKATLVLSAILLIVAIVMYWLCGFGTGLLMTLVCGALIVVYVKLIDKNPRWWLVILALIIAISFVRCSFIKHTEKSVVKNNKQVYVMDNIEGYSGNGQITTTVTDTQDTTTEDVKEENVQEEQEAEPVVVEKIVEKEVKVPVVVEKVVEKEVKVPVEKEVIKYVEKPSTQTTTTTQPTTNPSYNNNYYSSYYGDPTSSGYGYGYSNDPTMNNNYGYGYGYTGDPTSGGYNNNYYYSSSIKITGDTTVVAGDTETYTITGVSSISRNKFDLPDNVTIEDITGNRVELYFEKGWTGTYSIGYGSAELEIKVKAN